jgi:hypothetical protein
VYAKSCAQTDELCEEQPRADEKVRKGRETYTAKFIFDLKRAERKNKLKEFRQGPKKPGKVDLKANTSVR